MSVFASLSRGRAISRVLQHQRQHQLSRVAVSRHLLREMTTMACRTSTEGPVLNTQPTKLASSYDVVIVGGGIVGQSTAFFLKKQNPLTSVLVIEQDPLYNSCSTTRSAASIRHQFSNEMCIRMSQFGFDFLRNVDTHLRVSPDASPVSIDLVERGYLFLASKAGVDILRKNAALQTSLGCKTQILTPSELRAIFPWLRTSVVADSVPHLPPPVGLSSPCAAEHNPITLASVLQQQQQQDPTSSSSSSSASAGADEYTFGGDVVMGSLGLSGEGWFDAATLLHAFKKKNIALGVHFLDDRVTGFKATVPLTPTTTPATCYVKDNTGLIPSPGSVTHVVTKNNVSVACGHVVNAAGANGGLVSKMIASPLPVAHKKRCIFVFNTDKSNPLYTNADPSSSSSYSSSSSSSSSSSPLPPTQPLHMGPLTIDTSGVWFRPEGSCFIAGYSPSGIHDPDVAEDDFEVQHELFDHYIWPAIASRVPAFEAAKVQSAWAGHYEVNTFDHNGVVGPHPTLKNFLYGCGFSGHGLQHAPATGRALAETILQGRPTSIDTTPLQYERILENRPLLELNIV